MNQYPAGLVPMMVPQQYMVMPSAAMQLPHGMSGHHPHGALQPAAMLHHHQHMAAQAAAAASHAAGAPVMTSPVVTSAGALSALSMGHQGMVSIAGLPPHMTGVSAMGGAVPGLHQAISAGIPTPYAALTPLAATSALSSGLLTQQHQQHLQYPPQHASPQLQQLQHLQQVSPSPQQSNNSQDFRKKDDDRGYGRPTNNRWQAEADLDLDELNLDESLVVLDHFNSDLNLVIDQDGYGGTVLNNPSGFCFTWAGARATYGMCRGKAFFEVHVVEHLPVDFGDDHQETDPHIIRVGWSIDSSSFQLGEEPWSFGYGGTGKFSTNNRFSDYGVRFEEGDVIGAMLDLDSRPASISYMKNGTWYGVAAPLHGFPVGSKEMALFPHILSKNCRFKVNFGQLEAWFPPPMGFRYIGHLQLMERVRGMAPPARKSDCEMIMIVGLPGAGKTTWAINMQKNHPQKRYNIVGTDTLIDKMRVMGLPRKRNYHGRWEVLIDKATKCLNKYFTMAAKRRRNYILDQTNVYGSARRRKMKNFTGFYRIAAVIQPDDPELERRSKKRTQEDGKVVPESAVLEMKANFSLPEDRDTLFDRIDFIELQRDVVHQLVRTYNQEGKSKPRQDNPQNRFDGNKKQGDQRQQQYGGYGSQNYGRSGSYDKDSSIGKRDHWYSEQDELPAKRGKSDSGSALDLLKQQYEEDDRQAPTQQVARPTWPDSMKIKEEPSASVPSSQWSTNVLPPGYHPQSLIPSHATASQPGLLGAPPALHHGVQIAFLPPGMPPPPPSELAGLGLTAKTLQESPAHNAAQLAHAHAAAVHGQILLDPTKLRTGSPYTFASQATGQNLYGAAPPSYESLASQDSNRQAWQQATELGHGQSVASSHQQHQVSSWQQEQEESLTKSQTKPWEQEKSSASSWQSDFQSRRDGRDLERDRRDFDRDGRDFDKRGGGSRDSSFSRTDSRDRDRDRERDRDRDRDRNRDRDYGYNRNRNDDRGGYSNNDRGRDRRDGDYNRDSGSSWGNQGYGSSLSSDRQDQDFEKGDRQRKRKSKWDQPGDEQSVSLDQIKQESDMDAFSGGQSQTVQNMFCQPPPGFPGSSRFSSSPGQPTHPPGASHSAGDQDIKPSSFDMNFSRPPPPLMGNLKTDFSSSKDSSTPEIKLPPVGNSGDGLLGQGPGPKPLIPGLQGNMSAGQFKAKGSFSGSQPFRHTQTGGNDSSHSRSSDSSASRSNANANSRSSDNSTSSPRKRFSPDNNATNEDDKRASPKPLIKLEKKSPEPHSSPSDTGNTGGSSNQSRGGTGKPGLFPTPGSPEADVTRPKSPSFRPRGPPGLMGRFPGPPNGPPPLGGQGMLGPGPPPSSMGPRPPRGGPRGPPPHGPMGGPPRGPMGGPHHGPRGPGPWNQNRPRFGPRGPQGPPRPLFDGPPGRWPRPPR